jgi:signal transduction histidine kinase
LKEKRTYWLWSSVLIINALLILGTAWLYATLPLDGSSGDSSSFTAEGFLVKRIIEARTGGLEIGDIITSIDGASIEEWLHRSAFGRSWENGEILDYEVIRDEAPLSLKIHLTPVPFKNIISDWGLQIVTILGLFSASSFLFWKVPQNQTVRWILFFSTTLSVQYWIDAYNIQPATLLWGWVFWLQMILEQFSYSFPYAAALIFTLAFLYPEGLLKHYPIIFPAFILFSGTIIKLMAMITAPTLSAAFVLGNWVSVIPAMTELALALGLAIYFLFRSKNKILQGQLRILVVGLSLPVIITFIYSFSLIFSDTPIISRETGILLVLFVPLSFTITILRHQIFDIEIIIKKSLVYILLTFLLGISYLAWVVIITYIIIPYTTINRSLMDFIPTISIALAFNPLRLWIQKKIDHVFFRNIVDYSLLLPKIINQLSQNIVLEELEQVLKVEIPRQLQLSKASLEIFTTQERNQASLPKPIEAFAESENTQEKQKELSIPLIIGKSNFQKEYSTKLVVGQYNLGPKLSERPYSSEEIGILKTLGQQIAISVENARLYREIKRHNINLEEKIQERTQELENAKNIAENATSLLEKVMNNLDAFIYVGDMETGEILFANEPMLEEFGDIQGEVCWQALYQEKTSPCQTCSNAILLTNKNQPTGVHRQETQNMLNKRWYSVMSSAIPWVDGRMVRLATRLDITEVKEAQRLLVVQEREKSREKERQKLARDLHDTLTQSLHSLVMMSNTSQRLLDANRISDLPDSIKFLSESASQALRETRLLLHELQISDDKKIDLQETLR